jgi:hypothetical protein
VVTLSSWARKIDGAEPEAPLRPTGVGSSNSSGQPCSNPTAAQSRAEASSPFDALAAEIERAASPTLPDNARCCYAALQLQSELQRTYDGVLIWRSLQGVGAELITN